MKQFIVFLGIIPFMLIFILQFTLEQQRNSRILDLHQQVYAAKEVARQDGCFTKDTVDQLKSGIADTFQIEESEVIVEVDSVPKYRVNSFDHRELIHYRIVVPVKGVMAGAGFFGLSEEENTMYYVIENDTASELLQRGSS